MEKSRIVTLQDNAPSLTYRIDGMKKQKVIYDRRVLLAVAAWRVAVRNADEHTMMQVES